MSFLINMIQVFVVMSPSVWHDQVVSSDSSTKHDTFFFPTTTF